MAAFFFPPLSFFANFFTASTAASALLRACNFSASPLNWKYNTPTITPISANEIAGVSEANTQAIVEGITTVRVICHSLAPSSRAASTVSACGGLAGCNPAVSVKIGSGNDNADDEIKRRLTEVGFHGNAAAIATHSCGPMFQAMVMVWGPNGELINV